MSDKEVMVDRKVIRDAIIKNRRYWVGESRAVVSEGAIADVVIKVLAEEYGIKVCDSDWS